MAFARLTYNNYDNNKPTKNIEDNDVEENS
jgi:hypothetical protein